MQHFPIFLSLRGDTVAVSGGGEAAIAKREAVPTRRRPVPPPA